MSRLRARLRTSGSESGMTLVELLVASAMGVVVLSALGTMVLGAMRAQPEASKRAQNISTARWVLERLTREIRNGIAVDKATASSVSFRTYVRHNPCGSTSTLSSESPAIPCEVTYTCTTTSCSRIEAAPEVYVGTPRTIFSGINSSEVFCYVPSTNPDSASCGPATEDVNSTTHIGVTFHIPNPSGSAGVTISDGASLRNTILTN
jgi:type II secretory pathway pseudopilin PulG